MNSVLKLMSLDKVIEQNFIQLRPEMSLREMLKVKAVKN